jgi:RNA polymerase sigma-70 factor (ECF subfamily)
VTELAARREVFTTLYRRHHSAILAYALRRVGPEDAQDVVAETFSAAWRELANLPADLLPWLYRTASFRVANVRRSIIRQARVTARVQAQPRQRQVDHAARVVESVHIRHALRQLSDADREALLLTSWEDLSYSDAAFVVGCSLTAFKVRLLRARRRLARALAESADATPNVQTQRDENAQGLRAVPAYCQAGLGAECDEA